MPKSVFKFVPYKSKVCKELGSTLMVVCGSDPDCAEDSGTLYLPEQLEQWMDKHQTRTGHKRYYRHFIQVVERVPVEIKQ